MSENGQDTQRVESESRTAKSGFDWNTIRQRIATASAALSGMDETAPDVLARVWARRAARLAHVIAEEDQGEQIELVVVQLGNEVYGLEVQYVFEICPVEHITRVPHVPEWVTGVVNWRGHIRSVIDLQRFLGLPRTERNSLVDAHLIMVETPAMELALLADSVLAIVTLPVSSIQEATGVVRGIRPEYVRGVVARDDSGDEKERQLRHIESRRDGALLVILDLSVLLADKQLIVHEEVV